MWATVWLGGPDETYMDNPLNHELHPDLGHAVMGTLAMACAEDEGLHIVGGDSPRGRDVSAELNGTMAAGDLSGPYKHFVRRELRPKAVHASSDDLFHSVVNFNCDVSALRLDGVLALQAEREPLRNLKQKLQEMALAIPPMANLRSREEAFRDKANEIISHWKEGNRNWSKSCASCSRSRNLAQGQGSWLRRSPPCFLPRRAPLLGTLSTPPREFQSRCSRTSRSLTQGSKAIRGKPFPLYDPRAAEGGLVLPHHRGRIGIQGRMRGRLPLEMGT